MNEKPDQVLTIARESDEIFTAHSSQPYWSDGTRIFARLAFNESGSLSSVRAQTLDANRGNRYLLVTPFAIRKPAVLEAARKLKIGEAVDIVVPSVW